MNESSKKAQSLRLDLDYRWVSLALLTAVVAMLLVWKPWSAKVTDRTIDVTGTATISARPDEFVFYPTYDFENADKAAALAQMTAKSDEVVDGLKKAGVAGSDIKTNSDSWDYPVYEQIESTPTYTLRLTVTVGNDDLAQKVQDYLISTTPTGTISPVAGFSENKQKEVEAEARDAATKDARSKAEQSAKNLGFKLAAVKAVNDASGFGIYPGVAVDTLELKADSSRSSLAIQPGENELTYSVTVTYFIR